MKRPDVADPPAFMMTPMIDVVFQLIVFFLLVLDLSQRRIEKLTLPKATEARRHQTADPNEVVVNVRDDGTVSVDGRVMSDDALDVLFASRRTLPHRPYVVDRVDYPVLIRADRSAEWIHVQKVMQIASTRGGVYRVELGARKP